MSARYLPLLLVRYTVRGLESGMSPGCAHVVLTDAAVLVGTVHHTLPTKAGSCAPPARVHGRDAAGPGGNPTGAAARQAGGGPTPPWCAEQSRHRLTGHFAKAEPLSGTSSPRGGVWIAKTTRAHSGSSGTWPAYSITRASTAPPRLCSATHWSGSGPRAEDTVLTASNLACALQNLGKFAEAEPLVPDTLVIQQRVLGKERPDTLLTANDLG